MRHVAVKPQYRALRPSGRGQIAPIRERPDSVQAKRIFQIRLKRADHIVALRFNVDHSSAVATPEKHQRAVKLSAVIDEHRGCQGTWAGHSILMMPKNIVLVPLPDLTLEGSLRVDLELVYVDIVR